MLILLLCTCRSIDLLIAGYQGKDIIQISLFGTENINLQQLDKVKLKGFSIGNFNNAKVKRFIKIYQTSGKKNLIAILDRAYKYLPGIKKIFKKKGIPEDLAYLPLIESAFVSTARSHKKATGLWQFMYHTGRMYGLNNSWYHEDRCDPYKSTIAAAYHLKYLYKKFGDWLLVLAAYNAGNGKIQRGLDRYNTDNFWELARHRYLKPETKNYIPKFIAATLIAKNPSQFGLPAPDPEKFIQTSNYTVKDATAVEVLSRCAQMPEKDFKLLNPSLRRWTTPPARKYTIHVPVAKYNLFKKNLEKIPLSQRVTFRHYLIRLGDNLTTISRKFKVPIGPIVRLNKIRSENRIRAGNTIMIPIKGLERAQKIDKKKYNNYQTHSSGYKHHYLYLVKRKETLYLIAKRCGVGIIDIMQWNGLKSKNSVHPGDLLLIREYR